MGLEDAYKQKTVAAEASQVPVNESAENFPDLPRTGDEVILKTTYKFPEAQSSSGVGDEFDGFLMEDIRVGQSIKVGILRTGPVRKIYRGLDGEFMIETDTANHELRKVA